MFPLAPSVIKPSFDAAATASIADCILESIVRRYRFFFRVLHSRGVDPRESQQNGMSRLEDGLHTTPSILRIYTVCDRPREQSRKSKQNVAIGDKLAGGIDSCDDNQLFCRGGAER